MLADPYRIYAARQLHMQAVQTWMAGGDRLTAERLFRQSIQETEESSGPHDRFRWGPLCDFANFLRQDGRLEEADGLMTRGRAIAEKCLEPTDPQRGILLNLHGEIKKARRRFTDAEDLVKKAVSFFERLRGRMDTDVAVNLRMLASIYSAAGRHSEAEDQYKTALRILSAILPADSIEIALTLRNLADHYHRAGRFVDAEQCLRAASAGNLTFGTIDELTEHLEKNAPAVEKGLHYDSELKRLEELAHLHIDQARFDDLAEVAEQLRNRYAATFGPDHPKIAEALVYLAWARRRQVRLSEAQDAVLKALAVAEMAKPKDGALEAAILNELGLLRLRQGMFDQAEELLRQALAINNELGFAHPPEVLTNLGEVCRIRGNFQEAESFLRMALPSTEAAHGQNHHDVGVVLNNLGLVLGETGSYSEAYILIERSLEITRRFYGARHPETAVTLLNLALLCMPLNRFHDSILYCQDALDFLRGFPDPAGVVIALNQLASAYFAQQEFEEAEQKLREAYQIAADQLKGQLLLSTTLADLAHLLIRTSRFEEAAPLVNDALKIMDHLGAQESTNYSFILLLKALTRNFLDGSKAGYDGMFDAGEATWRHAVANFSTMSRRQKNDFIRHLQTLECGDTLYAGVFRETAEKDAVEEPVEVEPKLALEWALMRKQLFEEADRQESGALRTIRAFATAEWNQLWKETHRLRREYREVAVRRSRASDQATGSLVEGDPRRLLSDIEMAEQRLRKMNPEYVKHSRIGRVKIEDVIKALRPSQALAEFVVYGKPASHEGSSWRRYGVLLLPHEGEVKAIDLGPADVIDDLVRKFLAEMARATPRFSGGFVIERTVAAKAEREINESSAKLWEKVWQPIADRLGSRKRVYLAPDGMLGLIPFEALARWDGGSWRYLGEEQEDVEFVYLNTGRDLARALAAGRAGRAKSNTAIFFGDPNFDAEPFEVVAGLSGLDFARATSVPGSPATTLGSESKARRQIPRQFESVTQTRKIGEFAQQQLRSLGWNVTSYSGSDASKERVTGMEMPPRILQFCTHGYMLDPPDGDTLEWESPLLRSMLILAGANRWTLEKAVVDRPGGERIVVSDGILTAYEVTGLDLRGTDLVNLTACKTGRGEVTADGVVGLRQAFLLAGCRALTMSMWSIPTEETVQQIVEFYNRWLGDPGGVATPPYQAFRAAQRAAVVRARNSPKSGYSGHPFFWAGMIYAGDPGDLPEIGGRWRGPTDGIE